MKNAWTVLSNLIVLIVIIAVLNSANSQFEKIALSILILIYINIYYLNAITLRFLLSSFISLQKSIITVRDEIGKGDSSYMKEEVSDLEKQFSDKNTEITINAVFTTIFYIIAIFTLVTNL